MGSTGSGEKEALPPHNSREHSLPCPGVRLHQTQQLLIKGVNVHKEKIQMRGENLSTLFLKFFAGSQTRDIPVMKGM